MRSTFDASLVEQQVTDLPADSVHWVGLGLGLVARIGYNNLKLVGTKRSFGSHLA
ncbi:uncharacterized protein BP01DRAFT_356618 [Aspergillus saccharolyticus JOP 1030-1]|uniref:Uncharacterized protein n=1 Tax=Aspergillus saccharolyticus JOP 1030-1 TaxID=1450539 RepID=A0A318ZDH9_9EURO|nr:hypothetical protein BP01DRAFT_356618 [Aspergillus saccharolyticus JOP 1030-1]PYH45561.1 hypothetical protein BP01DRAFT_356618 [Aspergillus saccharolyticus JOP 1030-1]